MFSILLYRFHCSKELAFSRVLKRVREEKGQVLEINEAALELFWDKFEPLAADERFNIVEVDTST